MTRTDLFYARLHVTTQGRRGWQPMIAPRNAAPAAPAAPRDTRCPGCVDLAPLRGANGSRPACHVCDAWLPRTKRTSDLDRAARLNSPTARYTHVSYSTKGQ